MTGTVFNASPTCATSAARGDAASDPPQQVVAGATVTEMQAYVQTFLCVVQPVACERSAPMRTGGATVSPTPSAPQQLPGHGLMVTSRSRQDTTSMECNVSLCNNNLLSSGTNVSESSCAPTIVNDSGAQVGPRMNMMEGGPHRQRPHPPTSSDHTLSQPIRYGTWLTELGKAGNAFRLDVKCQLRYKDGGTWPRPSFCCVSNSAAPHVAFSPPARRERFCRRDMCNIHCYHL